MNKEKQELLDKCIEWTHDMCETLLGGIYIIPTRRKHDSGYKLMYIVGHTPYEPDKETQFYLLDTYCDVVDFGDYVFMKAKVPVNDLHLDISPGGVIHIWSNAQNMKVGYTGSSCTFSMVERWS